MRAYHTEGEPIGDTETLARLALEVGLPEDDVRDVLATDRYAADVREDERTAMSLGISAVPFFVVDRADGRRGRAPGRGARRAAAARLGGAGARMKQIGFITQGHSEYDGAAARAPGRVGHRPRGVPRPRVLLADALLRPRRGDRQPRRAHARHRRPRQRRAHHHPRGARGGVPRDAARAARGRLHRRGMTAAADARVCPHCGEPPGEGVFCGACGRNLASVDRLPTRAEWEIAGAQDDRPLADRCEEATAAFLAAMHAAGDPGTTKTKMSGGSGFRRPKQVEGWVRPPGRPRRAPSAQALRVRPGPQRRGRLPPARQRGPRLRHAGLPRLGAHGRAGAGGDAGRAAPDRRARARCSPPTGSS